MRRRPTEQDRAHELLIEWSAQIEQVLGSEYPPAPMSPTVQGDTAEFTRPEIYAHSHADYEGLDRAMRRVREIDPLLGGVLWQKYGAGGVDERLMAEEMGWTLGHWREWLDAARWAFLRVYEGGSDQEPTVRRNAANTTQVGAG